MSAYNDILSRVTLPRTRKSNRRVFLIHLDYKKSHTGLLQFTQLQGDNNYATYSPVSTISEPTTVLHWLWILCFVRLLGYKERCPDPLLGEGQATP